MAEFLDELDGGFVLHTIGDTAIAAIVGKRVYPDVAPQDESQPHIIYTQVMGHRIKSHAGVNSGGARNIVVHAYVVSRTQPQANQLAQLLEDRWLSIDYVTTGGTLVQVCNGGTYESGQWFPKDSSDDHLFFARVVLKMLIGN